MAVVVWLITGLALWHFTIFIPDRFWQGIVGALVGAVGGAVISGFLIQVALGRDIGQTDIITLLAAIPGFLIGTALIWWIGSRSEAADLDAGADAG